MKKFVVAAFISMVAAGSIFAADLQIRKVADISPKSVNIKDSENGFRITNKGFIRFFSAKRIPIDPQKKYLISCEYRLASGTQSDCHFYIAPVCYDKNAQELSAASQNCVIGSDTVLAAAAKKGDRILKIKDGKKWKKSGLIAFNTKADHSDLPNKNYETFTAVTAKGDIWEVALKSPLTKDYPAGTAVRNQIHGASYRYLLYTTPKAEWQKYSRVFQGLKAEHAAGSWSTWRIGTTQAGLIFFVLDTKKSIDIEFRNISITEVK